MKLDRNTTRGGRGKYALVNMRKLIPIMDNPAARRPAQDDAILDAFRLLEQEGIITLGNETPGDQFFVMKYKDKFTAAGLFGYAGAIVREAEEVRNGTGAVHQTYTELREYADQMLSEADNAQKLGRRIPD